MAMTRLTLCDVFPKLVTLQIDVREPAPTLAKLDPFSCNLRLQALSSASHSELSAIFRLVPDQLTSSHWLLIPVGKAEGRGHEANANELVRLLIEEQIQLVSLAKDHPNYIALVGSSIRTAANALRYIRLVDEAERVERQVRSAISQSDPTPLLSRP